MDKTSMIFCSALMAVILFACPFTVPQKAEAPLPSLPPQPSAPSPSSLPSQVSNPPNASANASPADKTEQNWAMISKGNVENACLSQAKKMAVANGYDEGLVFSCACSAQESGETKSYGCSVSALDGQHPLSIICTKSEKACSITAQGSESTYTFDQLQALANP